jgi:hypothetical protein
MENHLAHGDLTISRSNPAALMQTLHSGSCNGLIGTSSNARAGGAQVNERHLEDQPIALVIIEGVEFSDFP